MKSGSGPVPSTEPRHSLRGRLKWPTVFWLGLLHVGMLAAPWTFSWSGLALWVFLGWLTGSIGICLGFHRLLTHRSLAVSRPLRWGLAWVGSLAGQGPVIDWVADHRKHHALSDREGDPHSPKDGAWWSQFFWLIYLPGFDQGEHRRHWAPDLLKDPVMRWIDRLFLFWQFLFGGLLFGAGYLVGGASLAASWLVWGLFFRMAFVLHATGLVNSATHLWGYRNYETRDTSRNLWWVAVLTYGEGWHNNHHAHPRVACNRHRWWEFDPTYAVIRLLGRLHLAWDIVDRPKRTARTAAETKERGRSDTA